MNANWTRISGRTSAFAPTSSSVTGRPGTGSVSASAGRWTPGRAADVQLPGDKRRAGRAVADERLRARPRRPRGRPARSRLPASPRTARTGSGSLAIEIGASTISTPPPGSAELRRGAEQEHAHPLRRGEARAGGDLSRSEIGAVGVDRDDRHALSGRDRGRARAERHLATGVGAAHGAHTMGSPGAVAARARIQRRAQPSCAASAASRCGCAIASAWGPASAAKRSSGGCAATCSASAPTMACGCGGGALRGVGRVWGARVGAALMGSWQRHGRGWRRGVLAPGAFDPGSSGVRPRWGAVCGARCSPLGSSTPWAQEDDEGSSVRLSSRSASQRGSGGRSWWWSGPARGERRSRRRGRGPGSPGLQRIWSGAASATASWAQRQQSRTSPST